MNVEGARRGALRARRRWRRLESPPEWNPRSGFQGGPMTKQWERAYGARTGWRRRESNPGPQGIRTTLVHVRSRRVPVGWVRGFGHDLAPVFLTTAARGALRW